MKLITRRRHLVGTLSTLVGVNAFLAGLSFVTTLVVANQLGTEGFGDLAYAIAVGGYALTFAYVAVDRTLIRDLVQFPNLFDVYTSASIVLRGSMLVLALGGVLVLESLSRAEHQLGLAGLLIVFAEGFKALYLGPVYDARDEMRRHAFYLLAERLVYFALVWGLIVVARERLSVLAIGVFMAVSTALGFSLQYRWVVPRITLRLDGTAMSRAKTMLRKNLWTWSAVISTLSFGALSKIVMKQTVGSGELGVYAVAWQVVLVSSVLVAQIARIGNPRLAKMVVEERSREDRVRFVLRYGASLATAGAVIGVPAILFPDLLVRVFRPEFSSAAAPLRILGFYVIVLSVGQLAIQYLVAVRRESVYAIVTILSGTLSLVLFIVLIPRWSGVGASVAVVISHGLGIATMLVIVLRHVRKTRREPVAKPAQPLATPQASDSAWGSEPI